jgi:toxin HigB-1
MIRGFRHKGLRKLFEEGSVKGVEVVYARKIRHILLQLHSADSPEAMRLPGYNLHPLVGELKGYWSIKVSANWRIMFRFEGRNASDVDLVDYH